MIRIAIAEDEHEQQKLLEQYVKQWALEHQIQVEIVIFEDGSDLLDEYTGQFDLLFLDIKMKKMNGLDTARRIRQKDQRVLVVFVTNLMQYAIDGYEVDAVDFLVKPLNYVSFSQRMERVRNKLNLKNGRIIGFKIRKETAYLNIADITYLETERKKTLIHTRNHEYLSTETMMEVEEKLKGYEFFRVHKAYLVNMSAIESIDGCNVMIEGKMIPISKYRRKEFFQKFAKFEGFNS